MGGRNYKDSFYTFKHWTLEILFNDLYFYVHGAKFDINVVYFKRCTYYKTDSEANNKCNIKQCYKSIFQFSYSVSVTYFLD